MIIHTTVTIGQKRMHSVTIHVTAEVLAIEPPENERLYERVIWGAVRDQATGQELPFSMFDIPEFESALYEAALANC